MTPKGVSGINVVNMNYDVDYFIEKIKSIPREKWCRGDIRKGEQCCILGHLNSAYSDACCSPEARALAGHLQVFMHPIHYEAGEILYSINDGHVGPLRNVHPAPHPQDALLAALEVVKNGGPKL